jgi:hypothetical protein
VLKVRAPGFSFLKGEPVARLKDGGSLRVELAVMAVPGPGKEPIATTRRIFALSYDLWEERFAATTVGVRSQSVSHLALAAVEVWCVEQMTIPINALAREVPFWCGSIPPAGQRLARPPGLRPDRLHAAGAHRRVQPPQEVRVIAASARSRPVQDAGACAVLRAMSLRTRLIAAFVASTLLPLAATVWITTTLLDRSLRYATTGELDRLSRTLETTAKQFYQRERDALKADAVAGRTRPTTYLTNIAEWPEPVRSFWDSGEPERFGLSGSGGDHVDYLRRLDTGAGARRGVDVYSRDLHGVAWSSCLRSFTDARLVNDRCARSGGDSR